MQTQIIPPSGGSHQLDYVMRQAGPDWKAVDVLAEGAISRVATQRSDFRSLLAHGGGEALLASLDEEGRRSGGRGHGQDRGRSGRDVQAACGNAEQQSAQSREPAQMRVGVAEQHVDHGHALEVVADLVFHRHADAAMQLDRLLADMLAGPADLHLGRGDRAAGARSGSSSAAITAANSRHAARLLERDQHVDGAVLQHLELADRRGRTACGSSGIRPSVSCIACHRADRLGA